MAANKTDFVLVFCASSLPTPAELTAYKGPYAPRYRNGKFFDPHDIEIKAGVTGPVVKAVYTNNPAIRAAYESLKGQRVQVGAGVVTLDIPVYPISSPAPTNGLPMVEDLEAMKPKELEKEYGVSMRENGRLRKKADMIAEIIG